MAVLLKRRGTSPDEAAEFLVMGRSSVLDWQKSGAAGVDDVGRSSGYH